MTTLATVKLIYDYHYWRIGRLLNSCENKLKAAESRLEKLVQNGAQVTAEPADLG